MVLFFFSGSFITNVLIALISVLMIHNIMLSSGLSSSSYTKTEEEDSRLEFYCNTDDTAHWALHYYSHDGT